ncbi:MAG: type II secretion system F family protein [Armatimonadota bacterium]|jgi:type IV pilus assembly protein PilC
MTIFVISSTRGRSDMAGYWYATDDSSARQHIEAENLPQALLALQRDGVEVAAAGTIAGEQGDLRRVSWRTLIAVYEQLAAMVEQGAPLHQGLRSIAAETSDRNLAAALRSLAGEVEQGHSLSEAMSLQPGVWPPVAVSALRAGEEAGDLPAALKSLAEQQRRMAQIASGMAFPLVYPVVIALIGLGIFGFVATFIFPKFIELFYELGMERSDFPATTRFLTSALGRVPLVFLILAILVAFFVAMWLWMRRTEQGRFNLGLTRLRIPIFGEVSIYTDLARVAQTLSLLLRGGVDTVRALRLSRDAAQEPVLALALRRAGLVVEEGGTITEGLRETQLLPDEFIFRIGAAERSGALADVLERISEEYVEYADRLARKWVVVSGPVIVIILAVVLGFIGISMFLPLTGVISLLSM